MAGNTAVRASALTLDAGPARMLQIHLDRQKRWNPRGFARIVTTDGDLGFYAAPPTGVLTYVHLPIRQSGSLPSDLTVPMGGIAFEQTSTGAVSVTLPSAVPGPAELAVLPPEDSWHLPMHAVVGDVIGDLDAAIAEFKARAVSALDADALAEEIWDRQGFAGIPMRMWHTARLLGLLGNGSARIAASTRSGWKRLTTINGRVFVRIPGALDRTNLTVVR
jgi:hypothetical protein